MSVPSSGMLALRKSNAGGERVTIDGEMFIFKRLTIEDEERLEVIIREHQVNEPEKPADLKEDATETEVEAYIEAFNEYSRQSARAFRNLTADIMKYVLLDASHKPFFREDEDVAKELNNVYAEKFFKAYNKFRGGAEAGSADAERRFQK